MTLRRATVIRATHIEMTQQNYMKQNSSKQNDTSAYLMFHSTEQYINYDAPLR
jgi:hypothetical protein